MTKIIHQDGREFTVNELGQKVDEDGFFASSSTRKTNPPWFCVSVKQLENGDIGVRDTKDSSKKTLVYNPQEWAAFIQGAKDGEFDF
jgi:hypothetical protein